MNYSYTFELLTIQLQIIGPNGFFPTTLQLATIFRAKRQFNQGYGLTKFDKN